MTGFFSYIPTVGALDTVGLAVMLVGDAVGLTVGATVGVLVGGGVGLGICFIFIGLPIVGCRGLRRRRPSPLCSDAIDLLFGDEI